MDKTFEAWMQKVNAQLVRSCGVSSDDLEDANYYDMYEDEYTPKQAAQEVLENLGF